MKNFQKPIDKNHKKRYYNSGSKALLAYQVLYLIKITIQVSISLTFQKGGESHDIV